MDYSFEDAYELVLKNKADIVNLEIQDEPNTEEPVPGQIYFHFKKKLYRIVRIAHWSEDCTKKVVVYEQLYAPFKTYYRDLDMFMSPVDKVKYPDVEYPNRFNLVKRINIVKKEE